MTGQSFLLPVLLLLCTTQGVVFAAPLNDELRLFEDLSNADFLNDVTALENSLEEKSLEPQQQRTKKNSLEEKSLEPQQQRTKRKFGSMVMAASLGVSVASIGTEVFLTIKGCCGFYPEACRNADRFKALKPSLETKSKKIDSDYLAASKVLEFVKQCNYKNNEIWLELKRISELSQELITSIDPNLIHLFEKKQNEIKHEVQAKNQTVISMTYAQLSTEYQSMFKTALGTITIMSNIWGTALGSLGSYAYKQYRVNQITKTLSTDFGQQLTNANQKGKRVFGLDQQTVNAHLKKTAVAQYKASLSTSRMASFLTGANYVVSAFTAGFEIYSTIKKIMACEQVRDNTRNGLREIEKADAQCDELIKNVTSYKAFVDTQGWNYTKDQITGDEVTAILKDISKLAEESGKSAKTKDLTNAKATIDRFISDVPKADYTETYNLQKQLIVALGAVDFVLSCRLDQTRLKNYVSQGCKNGHDTLHNLYVKGVKNYPKINSSKCRDESGVPYTSESDIATLVKVDATNQKFQFDCVLNSDQNKKQACLYKYQGFTDAQIANDHDKMTSLSESQVHYFTKSCPPRDFLFPKEETTACNLRKHGLSDTAIAKSLSIPHLVSKIAALKCPTEPPPTALPPGDQEKVCKLRGYGMSDEAIANSMKFDLQLTKKVVCPTKAAALSAAQQKQVCQLRGFGLTNENIASTLKLNVQLVAAVTCS